MSAIEMGWEAAEFQDFDIDMQYSWWTASNEADYRSSQSTTTVPTETHPDYG